MNEGVNARGRGRIARPYGNRRISAFRADIDLMRETLMEIPGGTLLRRVLKIYAPMAFNQGLEKANELGKSMIASNRVESLLDVGCGDGELTLEFALAAGASDIHAMEYVDDFIEKARSRGIECVKGDMNSTWPFESDRFELVISSQSIEHVHNTRLYVEECYRCLKPGGQLLVLTENLASWINIGALLFGWQPFSTTYMNGWSLGNPLIWHADEPKDTDFIDRWHITGVSGTVGHIRVLTYRGLRDLMVRAGFQRVTMRSKGYLPLWGPLSDALCELDRRHGHFLVATGFK